MAQRIVSDPGIVLGTAQLASLLDSTREIIAVLSVDVALQFANSSFLHSLGYRPDELIGRSLHALTRSTDVGPVRTHLKQVAAQNGGPLSCRCRFRSRDGSWRWFEITCRSRLTDPAIGGILLYGLDVTELHRMESQRQGISGIGPALKQNANLVQLFKCIHV